MAVNPGDIIALSFSGTCFGQRVLFTQHYSVVTTPSASLTYTQILNGLIDTVKNPASTSLLSSYLACISGSYSLAEIRAQDIYPQRQVAVSQSFNNSVGARPDAVTTQLAAALTLRTALSGRAFVSTKHIGPICDQDCVNGTIQGTVLALLNTLADNFTTILSDVNSVQWQPVIYHKNGDGAAQKKTAITDGFAQNTVRVMRRRTLGRGE